MAQTSIITLDLNFQNTSGAIAAYLIKHRQGAVLVECGPGSTLPALEAGLAQNGLSPRDITHVLLTHIHLDHAGAAGWLSRQGAVIYVHPNGAPHLLDPAKLLASATRIYGDKMHALWGEFLPVEQDRLQIPIDGEQILIDGLVFTAVNTPGHAEHHFAYLFEDVCFSGDIGGVRIPGYPYLRAPMPPPELHFGRWKDSLKRLQALKFARIAPTHFGVYNDPQWQLSGLQRILEHTEIWLEETMAVELSVDALREKFAFWMESQGREQGLSDDAIRAYDLANPLGMSADGMMRYWKKVKNPDNSTNVTRKV